MGTFKDWDSCKCYTFKYDNDFNIVPTVNIYDYDLIVGWCPMPPKGSAVLIYNPSTRNHDIALLNMLMRFPVRNSGTNSFVRPSLKNVTQLSIEQMEAKMGGNSDS